MERICQGCGSALPPKTWAGRDRKWCSDRCRKQTLYVRFCLDCGAQLNGSDGNGPNAPVRCVQCAAVASGQERERWTCEAIAAAIREWNEIHGHFPTVIEWNPTHALALGCEPCRAYVDEPDRWPHQHTVMRKFGSWAAGVRAAGFEPRERGASLTHPSRRGDLLDEAVALYASGQSARNVAESLGVSQSAVLKWLRFAGVEVRPQGRPKVVA